MTMMIFRDPPDHTRLRSLANKAFTPGVLERIRSQVQDSADLLLNDVRKKGSMEVISELAYPLPALVISEVLGVADRDREKFKKWSDDLATLAGHMRDARENAGPASQSLTELIEFLRETVAERRAEPKDDLLSALVTAEDQNDSFTEDELYSMCVLLIFAGHVTTTNLIGNGILALLQNPSQLELLRNTPSLLESAVEEIIRYTGPVQAISRTALESYKIGDTQIKEGDRLSKPGCGEPRPGAVQQRRQVRDRAFRRASCRVRVRHPLLPRSGSSPYGRAGCHRRCGARTA